MINLTNKQLWTATKVSSVLFNSISTWTVIFGAFYGSVNVVFAVVGTLLAIALIDFLFVALVGILQAERSEDEVFEERWAYATGLVVLYAFILVIGFLDEGIMAFAPRVGLGIITMVATLQFVFQWRVYQDLRWQERFDKRKERQERKDQQKLLRKQRKVKNQQQYLALKQIKAELLQEYMEKHRAQLLTLTGSKEVPAKPETIKAATKTKEIVFPVNGHLKQLALEESLSKGIVPTLDGKFHWVCDFCEKESTAPSYRGAKIAQARHMNTCEQQYEFQEG